MHALAAVTARVPRGRIFPPPCAMRNRSMLQCWCTHKTAWVAGTISSRHGCAADHSAQRHGAPRLALCACKWWGCWGGHGCTVPGLCRRDSGEHLLLHVLPCMHERLLMHRLGVRGGPRKAGSPACDLLRKSAALLDTPRRASGVPRFRRRPR